MVAKGADDKPTEVPPLILEEMEDIRRFIEAIKRKSLRKEADAKLRKTFSKFIPTEDFHLLNGQRCETRLSGGKEFEELFEKP